MQLTRLNRAGLIIAVVLGLLDLTGPFQPTPDGQDGPPYAILIIDGVLGLITVAAAVIAWRTARRGAIRIAAGARIVSLVTALPAFFVDVPAFLQALVGLFAVLTVAAVAMMLMPARRPVPVSD